MILLDIPNVDQNLVGLLMLYDSIGEFETYETHSRHKCQVSIISAPLLPYIHGRITWIIIRLPNATKLPEIMVRNFKIHKRCTS